MIKSVAHDAVDFVQKAQLQYVSTFVKHEGLQETLTKYVEAQTQNTKSVLTSTIDVLTDLTLAFSKKDFAKDLATAYGFDKFVPVAPTKTAKASSKKA